MISLQVRQIYLPLLCKKDYQEDKGGACELQVEAGLAQLGLEGHGVRRPAAGTDTRCDSMQHETNTTSTAKQKSLPRGVEP